MSKPSVAEPGHKGIREVRPTPVESVAGTVEAVLTAQPDSGWGVYKVVLDGARRGHIATVTGYGGDIRPGAYIAADGRWDTHSRFGEQFKADVIRLTPPSTAEGVLKFLASGMVKGIGTSKATAIVRIFGEDTLNVIEKTPNRLLEVEGIGPRALEAIKESWKEHAIIRDLMVFLQRYGIPTSRAGRIAKKYGTDAVARISADPYTLARDIDGIGFITADRVAQELGVPPHSLKRVSAGLIHTLEVMKEEGHSAGPREMVLKNACKVLTLEPQIVEQALDHLVSLGELEMEAVRGRALIYLPYMRAYERSVATIILRLASEPEPPTKKIPFDEALARAERATGKVLSESQRQGLQAAMRNRFQIVTGGPGCGKSTILDTYLKMLEGSGLRVVLAAPTGRAAKRMEEVTGHPARTIHRLLEYRPGGGDFARNHRNPLEGDIFVVDESSMLDLGLAYKFLRALPRSSQLLLVGDVDQLPSVGAGSVLADIIQSGAVPVVWLREVFRQAAQSRIIVAAHTINQGKLPETPNAPEDDFFFIKIPEASEEGIKAMMLKVVTERIPARFSLNPMKDIQVLAPMHKGKLGIGELNKVLQAKLNAANLDGPKYSVGHSDFYVGDKVMQLRNDYDLDVFNGDVGFIREISLAGERTARIQFDDQIIDYPLSKFNELTLAYCCSIHKSQGSEWPAVVMPMVKGYYHMLQKNLVYTGLTRGKKLVVMVGDKGALGIACRNNKANERFGGLQQRLSETSDSWLDDSLFPE